MPALNQNETQQRAQEMMEIRNWFKKNIEYIYENTWRNNEIKNISFLSNHGNWPAAKRGSQGR